ncbi:MAG: lysine--tRNA ligase [Labilithrix sp.]|nr:lysine--tRNA ligase [Labilithrix sp.]MCW5817218.1 lysine--tRNA ligase [Labilithrix sp.]
MSEPTKPEGSSAEESLVAARRAKAQKLKDRKENPFANDVVPRRGGVTIDVGALRDKAAAARGADGKYTEEGVKSATAGAVFHVRGRIIAFRSTGGLSFLRLRDRTGEIQLLVSEAALGAEYTRLEEMDLGDIVESEGTLTASKRGELSIEPLRVRILTKALRPPPEKWHGLQDVETRYRQRYVDLVANPHVADVFKARSHIVRATRKVFDEMGFLEVETPTLHTIIGGAVARPFHTHHNALDMNLFMRIAPELYLKRLLVGGLERVYEIGRCYRNEGISTRHNPEFTMLEYYWAYATYDTLMDFTETMLRAIDAELAKAMPEAQPKWKAERPFTFDEPFARVPMNVAVANAAKATGIAAWADKDGGALVKALVELGDFGGSMKEWSKSSPRAKAIDWGNLRKGWMKCENDGERLFALYEYLSEPFLTEDYKAEDGKRSRPVFVIDYPFETSPLARRNDASPHLVDRFELFVHGRELCNAFSELNDPDDQAERFREQVRKKAAGAEETMDYDEDYIRALEQGMPPAAGFGMGIDRLVMMLTNAPSIRDVILFPLLRKED